MLQGKRLPKCSTCGEEMVGVHWVEWRGAISYPYHDTVECRPNKEPMVPRTPDDGGQHASVTPWVVSGHPGWFAEHGVSAELAEKFWIRRAPGVAVLEPFVQSETIPRVLRACYNLRGDGNWTLNVRQCPPDVRDYFPNLMLEKNMKEWEELPEWQRVLYEWIEEANKYALGEFTRAWHVEEAE